MKIKLHMQRNRARSGSSVVIVLLLIAILFMYINATLKTLHVLGRNISLVEKRQVTQWQQFKPAAAGMTNDLPHGEK